MVLFSRGRGIFGVEIEVVERELYVLLDLDIGEVGKNVFWWVGLYFGFFDCVVDCLGYYVCLFFVEYVVLFFYEVKGGFEVF